MRKHELYFSANEPTYIVRRMLPDIVEQACGRVGFNFEHNDAGGYWNRNGVFEYEPSYTLTLISAGEANADRSKILSLARSLARTFKQESVLVATFDGDCELVYAPTSFDNRLAS